MLEIGNQVVWWMTPANFFTVKGFNSGYRNKSIWAHHLINNTAFSLFAVCVQKSSTLHYDSKFVIVVVVVLSVFFLKTGGSLGLMLSHFFLDTHAPIYVSAQGAVSLANVCGPLAMKATERHSIVL